jgi:hypothetical protein
MALSLKAFLGLDGSGFELGMKRAESALDKFEHKSNEIFSDIAKEKVAEFFGFAALEEGSRRAIEYAHRIGNIAKQMSITADEAQQFDYQMSEGGASVEQAAKAFNKLKLAQAEVLKGSREYREYFERFGISGENAGRQLPMQLFNTIGARIGATTGDLSPGQQTALDKLMGRGADALIPAFKSGKGAIPQSQLIPSETIEQLHGYGSELSGVARSTRKFFADLVTIPYELLNVAVGTKRGYQSPDARSGAEFLRKRFDRMFGLDQEGEEKGLSEMESKLKAAERRKEARQHPTGRSIDINDLNPEQQAKAAQSLKEVFDAAKILSERGRPQIHQDIRSIQELRMRADAISDDGSNPANNAEAASLRFQAYQKVRALINPFPDRISLNALQSAGLQGIDAPQQNLGRSMQRLITVMDQLVSELKRGGVIVPRLDQPPVLYR